MTPELKHDMAVAAAKAIDAMQERQRKNPRTKEHYDRLINHIKSNMERVG